MKVSKKDRGFQRLMSLFMMLLHNLRVMLWTVREKGLSSQFDITATLECSNFTSSSFTKLFKKPGLVFKPLSSNQSKFVQICYPGGSTSYG